MMTALDHPLVQDYLRALHDQTSRLRPDEGRELEAQIREHLGEALGEDPTESEVREVLDRIGDPAQLVDEAGGVPESEPGGWAANSAADSAWREVAALVLLVGSGLLFWLWPVAVPMWLAGMVLLLLARRWSVGDKVWGGLVLGLGPWLAVLAGALAWTTVSQVCTTDSAGVTTCTGGGDGGLTAVNVIAIAFTIAYLGLYLWTVIRLARVAARG